MLLFPPDFLWAAATAGQQVEGHNFNSDWSEWEQLPGKIKNNDSSRIACDWWGGRWREDLDRAQALGMIVQRIGIEWARLEPQPGQWDAQAAARYREMIAGIRERGMEPFVTLHHFTSPKWVAERGGFENPEVAQWAAKYAERAAQEFQDLVTFWITINEPNVYAAQCYFLGLWLAQKKDPLLMFRVLKNEIHAHATMYHAIKRVQPAAQVGYSHHWRVLEPLNAGSPLDRLVTGLYTRVFNEVFFTAIEEGVLRFPLGLGGAIPKVKGTQDYIGVNYYYQENVAFDITRPGDIFGRRVVGPDVERLHRYFEGAGHLDPGALYRLLLRMKEYNKPIYITENGFVATDRDDQVRYMVTHLQAVHRAIREGADVRGYFWWSLLDNFEWSEGYTPRFGLYHTDFETQTRTLRDAGRVYEQIVRANGIPDELVEQYPIKN
ncbi:MAG: glycoside hydrolase family 1 protein [Anaerolineae bacterium]|nr:glycoside hydrolase family 1 protein [Anaerolineae bacterium]